MRGISCTSTLSCLLLTYLMICILRQWIATVLCDQTEKEYCEYFHPIACQVLRCLDLRSLHREYQLLPSVNQSDLTYNTVNISLQKENKCSIMCILWKPKKLVGQNSNVWYAMMNEWIRGGRLTTPTPWPSMICCAASSMFSLLAVFHLEWSAKLYLVGACGSQLVSQNVTQVAKSFFQLRPHSHIKHEAVSSLLWYLSQNGLFTSPNLNKRPLK
jgi:hypothetical protein